MTLYSQSLSALSPSSVKDLSTCFCPHAHPESMGSCPFGIAFSVDPSHTTILLIKDLINFNKIMPPWFCQDKTLNKQELLGEKIKGELSHDLKFNCWSFF